MPPGGVMVIARTNRLAPDALRPGSGAATWNAGWGFGEGRSWARASFLDNWYLGVGNGEERSPAAGYAVSDQPGGNRVARASVRSAVSVRPEHVEAAAALLVFDSNPAVIVTVQPEPVVRSSRYVRNQRSV